MPKSRIPGESLSSRRRKQTKCQKISKVLTVPCVILLFLLIISIFSWMGVEVNSIYKRINAAITQSSADIEDLQDSVRSLYDLPRRQPQLYMGKFHYCTIRHLFSLKPIEKSFEKLFRRTWTLSTRMSTFSA